MTPMLVTSTSACVVLRRGPLVSKCKRLTVDQLAKRLAAEKGRKLTTEEKAGLKLLPPQFVCGSGGASMDSDDQAAYDAAAIKASGGQVGFRINKEGTSIRAFKKP